MTPERQRRSDAHTTVGDTAEPRAAAPARGRPPRAAAAAGLLLGAALASAAPAGAQYFGQNKVQYDNFDWRVLRTEHFGVHFYTAERPVVDDMARLAERWRARLSGAFNHRLTEDKPIVFYGSHTDFQQTNVTPGFIGEGTGGFTDAARNRVVMPLTATYSDNDHVLGHELVHVYQYDIASAPGGPGVDAMNRLPLWLIEGMAEYLSLGREHPHTAMWLRDDVLRGRRPTVEQLTRDSRFFPYRYGHALWAYVGGRWGDQAVAQLYRTALREGFERAIPRVLGVTPAQLSATWMDATYALYLPLVRGRVAPGAAGDPVVVDRGGDNAAMNVSPSVSPDGRYVAYFTGRGLLGIELHVADTRTGRTVKKLTSAVETPHFEALSFLETAGAWSPDGRKFAFVVTARGQNQVAVLDVASGRVERRIAVPGVDALANPAWSPDGGRLALSGTRDGLNDLYVYDLATRATTRLTSDRHADIQPAWAPDGRTIAFATDRGRGTSFARLTFAPMQLALVDVATRAVRLLPGFGEVKHITPQFSPDGRALYFVSNRDGFSNVYRTDLATGQAYQVTNVATGVSGITDQSAALSVAAREGRLLFSVFEENGYNIYGLTADRARGAPVTVAAADPSAAGLLPPAAAYGRGLVSQYLRDPLGGLLPAATDFAAADYRPALGLEYLGPPTLGVAVNRVGASIGGGVSALFTDLLGNQAVGVALQTGNALKDVGGQLQYINRTRRWNWGVTAGLVPQVSGETAVRDVMLDGAGGARVPGTFVDQYLQRVYVGEGTFVLQYPFSRTRRFETTVGYQGIFYDNDVERLVVVGDEVVDRRTFDAPAPKGLNFVQGAAALVGDNSLFGLTSPVAGGRYRFEVAPTFGAMQFQTLLADYRRYLFARPVTFAVRGLHYGRYGADAQDPRLPPLFLGAQTFVRGYGAASFDPSECSAVSGRVDACPEFDRLVGSRIAIASAELRLPVLGPRALALVPAPALPIEVAPFADAGLAWSRGERPVLRFDRTSLERVPVVSAGVAARVNLFGYAVVELFAAKPFQRSTRDWVYGFQLAPGW